ncbi:MAG: 50S ribosomal protein L23 [Bacteroidetes bacterium]|jgi:large subunit ribosomal protein L23|nr:50S ribosomal protein L23 [Bacteroidota bacterium]MBT5527918.1 50S ribosomal protein L23 [Cytophagia bacterium]MBT3424935.1 50S ribosomal protein L23 [Bacteroidota bacterium]MBT4338256.1 50S ribosomal protein L23 [Bacteroidota bacterium]MBT4727782.1 50S ribosomal protein L23 [Bacteroidota bacterium]
MNIIKKPLITEKYSALGESQNKYGFIVDKKASKDQIKYEVEKLYSVEVTSVNTMIYLGKPKTRYTKRNIVNGRTNSFKKAVVSLKEGQIIDFYSNI